MKKSILVFCTILLFMAVTAPVRSEDNKTPEQNAASTAVTESKPAAAPENKMDEVLIHLDVPFFSPLFSEVPVAKVNDDRVSLQELRDAVAASHQERTGEMTAKKVNYAEILDRLVNSKLIIQQARDMGMDELPEVKAAVADYRKRALREMVVERYVKDAKADQDEANKIYKDMIMEWKIRSVLFFQEDDAKKMLDEIKAGKSFEELAKKAVDEKKAKGNEEADFVKPDNLLPYVAVVVAKMEKGAVSPIVRIQAGKENSGYSVMRLVDLRYVDNAEAKEKANDEALSNERNRMLQDYKKRLIAKRVKVDKKLLNKLNFAGQKPGIEKLLNDKRVVAVVKGEKPITVGVLAGALKSSFYHGINIAAEEKRVDNKKYEVLNSMIEKELLEREAAEQGLEKTKEYGRKENEYMDSLLFGMFIQKAVIPDVKITKEEIETYYKAHVGEFSSPEMMRIRSLAFTKREYAEDAAEKLRKGTDFDWLVSNADGQVKKDDKNADKLLELEGNLVTLRSMPEGLQEAVTGAKADEVKLYSSPDGYYYVLLIKQVVPPKSQELEAVQQDIAKKIFNEKIVKSVEEWGAKLRKAGDVKTYLSKSN